VTYLDALYAAAFNVGSWAATTQHRMKVASAVPGLMTPDEEEAAARAEHLVPVTMTGPLANRGYAEVVSSPGAMPTPPPPADGFSYSPEERAILWRTALARMGAVARDRADRENLAAGGHLRIASAPWQAPVLAQPPWGDEGQRSGSATRTEYLPEGGDRSNDGFAMADRGAGLLPSSAYGPVKTKRAQNDALDAEFFARLAKRDSVARDRFKSQGSDPLADLRETKRKGGLNAQPDASWGPSFSSASADPSAAPLSVLGGAS